MDLKKIWEFAGKVEVRKKVVVLLSLPEIFLSEALSSWLQ